LTHTDNVVKSGANPRVRFHPKFLDLSAAFPDVAFVTVDIDTLDDATLDLLVGAVQIECGFNR
jgi:thioredoxin 1